MKTKNVKIPQNNPVYFLIVYPKIIETIRLTAAPYKDQIAVFDKEEFPPDEISFLIEHALLMAHTLYKNDFITELELNCLRNIDGTFERFSKGDWTIESMHQGESWNKVREISKLALKTFGVEYAKPNLYWCKIIDQ